MTRLLRILGAPAVAWLLAAAAEPFAASPPVTDELLAPLTSAYMRAVKPGEQAELHRDLFETVLQRVHRSHARDVDVPGLIAAALKTIEPLEPQSGEPADVFRKTINAALATLDPHSRYLDPRAQSSQRSAITGTFGGLGLQVEMIEGLVRVVAPMPGTPAARAGLQSGDLIVRFDDQPVQGMELTDAISRMRGEPGTPIALMIRRAGHGDEFSVSLVRETIRTQVLRWSMEGEVLVLRLASFTGSVSAAMEKAIADATAIRQPRGVVLDMRGNGGGLFRQAVMMADAFLGEGEIVSLRGRNAANRRTWQADPAELLAGVPMVVLIDGRSASASELVAAALQENGRATVMGQRSFGKGSLQSIVSLGADKGALRLTTALYQGPSGRSVQRTGVGPDIELVAASGNTAAARRREADRAQAL
ncbi:MAG TPA: S41 family peptidase, partial [Candidatus Limnocylindrales bacterium]|nr:S41 family peptidase [Candidatus Limnocylindrales bacterium]